MRTFASVIFFSLIALCCSAQKKQTTQTGPKAVDLGLSVKWASCNIGATVPEDVGYYYSWGELKTKKSYTEKEYAYYVPERIKPARRWNDKDGFPHYEPEQRTGGNIKNIGTDICGTRFDVAKVKYAGRWRMPTNEEVQELYNNCRWERTTKNDIPGIKITGPNGNWIFIPFSGIRSGESKDWSSSFYIWTGELYESYGDDNTSAYALASDGLSYVKRYYGCCVRPVYEKPQPKPEPVASEQNEGATTSSENNQKENKQATEEVVVDEYDLVE